MEAVTMGLITLENVRDATYKLLNEYQTITGNVDLNVVSRVDEQINLCYWELATKDKVSASFWISQFPVPNLLYPSCDGDGGSFVTESYETSALTYNAASACSYYFEVDNYCDVDIIETSSGGTAVTLSTLNIAGISVFTQYTGFITALSAGDNIQQEEHSLLRTLPCISSPLAVSPHLYLTISLGLNTRYLLAFTV
jgi:hypothetical protein